MLILLYSQSKQGRLEIIVIRIKTSRDIEESAVDPQCRCLKAITKLQPSRSYEPYLHDDHDM
jgi:hypothetical protein